MRELESQIRVANIIEDGRLAGPQNRMMMVASVLSKNIYTKIIFPKKNSKEFQQRCDKLDIKYLALSLTTMSANWISIIKYIFLFPYEILTLFFLFKKNHFDLVHVSGGCWQFKGVIAAKLAKVKVIWHLNDTYAPFLIKKIFSFVSPLANTFIFASERTKKYYENFLPPATKNFLIQSPVNVNFFDPNAEYNLDEFQKEIHEKKKIIIGTIGNINPNKGHLTFLRTAKILSSYSNNLTFLIAGPIYNSQKKYFKFLKDIIYKENITNVHFIENKKDIRPLLKLIDIYVCSSDYEASPLSVWEAMAMEKAIVSTDVGDVKKFIKNGVNGFIVNKEDSDGIAKCIIKLIEKPQLKNDFGKSARLVAKNKLDLYICANLHSQVYEKTFFKENYKTKPKS